MFCAVFGVIDCGRLVPLNDVDAKVVEEKDDVVDLLGVQLDVPQRVGDVLGGQVAPLTALGEQFADLIDGWFCRFRRPVGCVRIDHRHCLVPHTAGLRQDAVHAAQNATGSKVVR